MDLTKISTERRNKNSKNIDKSSTIEILKIINKEDALVAKAVSEKLDEIEKTVALIFEKFKKGGRLIYLGAGSSGRIGVLDASEMLPTYGISRDQIFGIIAGGEKALIYPCEGVEDDELLAIEDLKAVNFSGDDVLIGIAASGRTPYVLAGLKYCQSVNGLAIGLTMTTEPELSAYSDQVIIIETGQEVVTGSTRMKSGTATKLVLNMISTTVMIKYGKIYQNLMVDLVATNEKLKARVASIVSMITKADSVLIMKTLSIANYQCKNAIVMVAKDVDYPTSVQLLAEYDGNLSKIL